MNNNFAVRLLIFPLSLGIAGCGGGGGGGASAIAPVSAPFVKWSSIAANTTYAIPGDSVQGTYTWNANTDKITAITPAGAQQSGATLTEAFNSNSIAQSVRLQTAAGTDISFERGIDTFGVLIINNNVNALVSANGTNILLSANPTAFGWDYQSYGVWATGAGTGSGTYGAASVGAPTAGGSVPTTGTATYTGSTGGRQVAADGSYFFTSSNMSAATNFATRSISFSTSGTLTTPNLITQAVAPALNMTGTLTYAAGANQFTGNVSTTSGLAGTATGRFYGPAAQEIGGTFGLTGAGISAYVGAFGGKR